MNDLGVASLWAEIASSEMCAIDQIQTVKHSLEKGSLVTFQAIQFIAWKIIWPYTDEALSKLSAANFIAVQPGRRRNRE